METENKKAPVKYYGKKTHQVNPAIVRKPDLNPLIPDYQNEATKTTPGSKCYKDPA